MTEHAPLPRAERLDRLPFTRQHGRLLAGSGVGWALDAMDVGLVSFVLAALAVQWCPVAWPALGDRLDRLRRDGGRAPAWAAARRSHRASPGLRAHPAGVRGRHRRLRPGHWVGAAPGAALPGRSGTGRGAAGRLHAGQRVRTGADPWPGGRGSGGVLGAGLAAGGGDRLPGRPAVGERLALGVRPRHAARAAYAVVVRWGLPESVRFLETQGARRRGRGGRPPVRGLGRGRTPATRRRRRPHPTPPRPAPRWPRCGRPPTVGARSPCG